jgi:tRNA(fMet)-specific endonuclease VapC
MGLIVDTGVFIRAERDKRVNLPSILPTDAEIGISAITLSELYEGLEFAAPGERHRQRHSFIQSIERDVPIYDFDAIVARVHARLRAEQRRRGKMIGAHDLIIAATAMNLGWEVLTFNSGEFRQVDGLVVREI